MKIGTPEKIKEIVLKSHELESNQKTADFYNISKSTVSFYRNIYYAQNPSERVLFKRVSINNGKPITPERVKEVSLIAHKLGSNTKTARILGLSEATVKNYRKFYYAQNPSEKIEFKRGGANRKAKEINTIDDFPNKGKVVARILMRNPNTLTHIVAKRADTSTGYVLNIKRKMKHYGFIKEADNEDQNTREN